MAPKTNERGAILIMAAVALFALVSFSAIVIDYGVLWNARTQAQTAADAGALAGAMAISQSQTNTVAQNTAKAVARETPVWGQKTALADIVVSNLPYPCPASAGGGSAGCIRVDVMRGAPDDSGAAHANNLPVFFASMLGIGAQGVRATATAQVAAGNAAKCIKPWAVADKWLDHSRNPAGWNQNDVYTPGTDVYIPPSQVGTTGFTLANDYGVQLPLKEGSIGTWSSGWAMEIQFPGHTGSSDYRDAISGCPSWVPEVGLYAGQVCDGKDDADPARGCIRVKTGMSTGPTRQGVEALIAQDPSAYWDTGADKVVSTHSESPRIVPIPIFDIEEFSSASCGGSNCVIKVVNIMGFFVEGFCDDVTLDPGTVCSGHPNKDVIGRLVGYVGTKKGGAGTTSIGNHFLQVLRLVR